MAGAEASDGAPQSLVEVWREDGRGQPVRESVCQVSADRNALSVGLGLFGHLLGGRRVLVSTTGLFSERLRVETFGFGQVAETPGCFLLLLRSTLGCGSLFAIVVDGCSGGLSRTGRCRRPSQRCKDISQLGRVFVRRVNGTKACRFDLVVERSVQERKPVTGRAGGDRLQGCSDSANSSAHFGDGRRSPAHRSQRRPPLQLHHEGELWRQPDSPAWRVERPPPAACLSHLHPRPRARQSVLAVRSRLGRSPTPRRKACGAFRWQPPQPGHSRAPREQALSCVRRTPRADRGRRRSDPRR